MKALVTGGTGFVGSHVVEALVARGDRVTCLVRSPRKAAGLFPTGAPIEFILGQLADERALERAAKDADVIFHVAGLTGARRGANLLAVNRDGTARVLAAARRTAPRLTRFMYVSSMSAAGPSRFGEQRKESDPSAPVSAYGRSKLAAEDEVRRSNLPWTIVRPPSVYGPRDREFLRLFRLAAGGIVPALGSPAQELSFVHARDLAAALLAATAPACAGRTYYASHPEVVTARDTVLAMQLAVARVRRRSMKRPARMIQIPPALGRIALWASAAGAALMGRDAVLNPDKLSEFRAEGWACRPAALERDTGWRAALAAREGFLDTAEWYVQHRWL